MKIQASSTKIGVSNGGVAGDQPEREWEVPWPAARRLPRFLLTSHMYTGVLLYDSMGPRRLPTVLLATFGMLALSLAAVGISGVVSYSVAQRTHEIGIRMALGARPAEVLDLVLTRSMGWTLVGIGIGITASLALTRLLSGLLFGVRPMDPLVLGSTALLVAGMALSASYVPARHATKVDPIAALRCE